MNSNKFLNRVLLSSLIIFLISSNIYSAQSQIPKHILRTIQKIAKKSSRPDLALSQSDSGQLTNTVVNGGFETADYDSTRPAYWYEGFVDSPQEYSQMGDWAYDYEHKTEGTRSMKLMPHTTDGYMLSQILHAPTHNIAGQKVRLQLDVRQEGLQWPPVIIIAALNPELPPDDDLGGGITVKIIKVAEDSTNEFHTFSAEVTATDNANTMFIACTVSGDSGAAWFDNISVESVAPEKGPEPEAVDSPFEIRPFKLGFVQENPIDYSEIAMEQMINRISHSADVINLFFHVRWCEITGENLEWGHRDKLRQAQLARQAGLEVSLTLDFTHEHPDNVGHVNPTPDGTPVGSFNDPKVVSAYQNELFALCDLVQPEYVIVGIETNIFYMYHPEQWAAYVKMFKEIAHTLTMAYPDIHVTAYFTLDWMVDTNAQLNRSHASIWKQLLPELQSIAFSTYPGVLGLDEKTLAPGYFKKAAEIAPDLPVILPEFGAPGGPTAQLSLDEQVSLTKRIFEEIAQTNLHWACWFSMYDQSYLGVPEDFKVAFRYLGMHTQDGTPKPVWALWNALYQTEKTISQIPQSDSNQPVEFELFPNYPNPFNAATTIQYHLSQNSHVTIQIYNLAGQVVRTLVDENQSDGIHSVVWHGLDEQNLTVASGIYFCQVEVGSREFFQQRVVFLK